MVRGIPQKLKIDEGVICGINVSSSLAGKVEIQWKSSQRICKTKSFNKAWDYLLNFLNGKRLKVTTLLVKIKMGVDVK